MKLNSTAAPRLIPALVILAACAVYLNSLANGFALDDVYIIQHNPRVHHLGDWRNIWLTPYWPNYGSELGLYRPFIIFVYAVQWAVGGGSPWVFHLGNVLLHAAATLLVFLLLERLTARGPALMGALIFGVHPVHTEAVANVVGQAELVAGIALLGACLIHINRPLDLAVSWPRRIACCLLFAIGLLTKESAVVLPALLIAMDFAQRRVRLTRRGFAAYADAMLIPLLLLGCTLGLYLIVRYDVMSGALIGMDAGPSLPYLREEDRILNALRAFPEFVRLLSFPLDLASDYSPGVILPVDSLTMMTLLGALLLASLTGLALLTPRWPAVGLPAVWFLVGIVTVSNLFFPIGVLVAERTLYVPSVAVSLFLAYAWLAVARRAPLRTRRIGIAAVLMALTLFGVRTWTRNPSWESTSTVLDRLADDHPESYKSQWAQGTTFWGLGRLDEAHVRFAMAYRLYPRDSQFMVSYGKFLQARGNNEAALALFEQSYALHPFIVGTGIDLAYAYMLVGRYRQAIDRITELEALFDLPATYLPMRAQAFQGLGEHDRAVGTWRVALRQPPLGRSWIAWAFLARSLAIGGYHVDAASALDRARSFAADSAARHTLDHLGRALATGCFEQSAIEQESMIPAVRDCDPLGDDFFRFSKRQAEFATLLQNASVPLPQPRGRRVPGVASK